MYTQDHLYKNAIDKLSSHLTDVYMPTLILSLFRNGYLKIVQDVPASDPTVLLRCNHNELTQYMHNDIPDEWMYAENVSLIYWIPRHDLEQWITSIEFCQQKFIGTSQENLSEDELFYKDSVTDYPRADVSERVALLQFASQLIEYREQHYVFDFSEVFFYLVTHVKSSSYEHVARQDLMYESIDEQMYRTHAMALSLFEFKQGQTFYNPYGGLISLCCVARHLHPSYHIVCGTHLNFYYRLGIIFMLGQLKSQPIIWKSLKTPCQPGYYENILLNLKADCFQNLSRNQFRMVEKKVISMSLNQLRKRGRMVVVLSDSISNRSCDYSEWKDVIESGYLREIVNFLNQTIYFVIDKDNTVQPSLVRYMYIDGLPSRQLYYNQLKKADAVTLLPYDELRTHFNQQMLTFYLMGYNQCLKRKNNCTKVPLSALLKVLKPTSLLEGAPEFTLNDYLTGKRIKEDYRFHPFLTADDGGSAYLTRNDYCLEEEALIFSGEIAKNIGSHMTLRPFIFDPAAGNVCFNGFAFEIDKSKVDPEYLIMQMNQNYFQRQVRKSKLIDTELVHSREQFEKEFLSLYVEIPISETTLERQRQIVNSARLVYVQKSSPSLTTDLMLSQKGADNLPKGTLLFNGKYCIKCCIGSGGFGRTYHAIELASKKKVAIKEFFLLGRQVRDALTNRVVPKFSEDLSILDKARQKFYEEAVAIQALSDVPNVVKVYDVFDENGTAYYSMEYIDGSNLHDYVIRKCITKRLSEGHAVKIIRKVAEALKGIHAMKMNHLDVKPSNIMINARGTAIKLIDFGAAKLFSDDITQTWNSGFVFSGEFTDPNIRKIKNFDPRVDIYSLGVTLEFLLRKNMPAAASCIIPSLDEESVSPGLCRLIMKCQDSSMSNRPQNMDEFIEELDKIEIVKKKSDTEI